MAFPLDHGPFGKLLCDAFLDLTTADPYRAGFDAFLYLGPLGDEIVSPLISGFYTDEHAREVDRRCRLMRGRGLEQDPDIGQVSGEAIRRWQGQSWGQPLREWRRLGPLEAWQYGSKWREAIRETKHRDALKDSTLIRREAEGLFEALRKADYSQPQNFRTFPEVQYLAHSEWADWVRWVCEHFRTNSIVQVDLGAVALQPGGRPAVPYKLTLKDRTVLEGILPFRWEPDAERWEGLEGLDWHLRK